MEFGVEDHPRGCFRRASRPNELPDDRRRVLLSTRGIDRGEKALIGIGNLYEERIPLDVSTVGRMIG